MLISLGLVYANFAETLMKVIGFEYKVCDENSCVLGWLNLYGYMAIKETETSYVTATTASGYVYSNNSSAYPDQTYTMDDSGNYWWYVRVD